MTSGVLLADRERDFAGSPVPPDLAERITSDGASMGLRLRNGRAERAYSRPPMSGWEDVSPYEAARVIADYDAEHTPVETPGEIKLRGRSDHGKALAEARAIKCEVGACVDRIDSLAERIAAERTETAEAVAEARLAGKGADAEKAQKSSAARVEALEREVAGETAVAAALARRHAEACKIERLARRDALAAEHNKHRAAAVKLQGEVAALAAKLAEVRERLAAVPSLDSFRAGVERLDGLSERGPVSVRICGADGAFEVWPAADDLIGDPTFPVDPIAARAALDRLRERLALADETPVGLALFTGEGGAVLDLIALTAKNRRGRRSLGAFDELIAERLALLGIDHADAEALARAECVVADPEDLIARGILGEPH